MTPRLLKIIASVVLVLSLSAPAFAIVPLLLSAAEVAAPYVVMAGISLLMPTSSTTNVPRLGSADNYGIKRNMLAKVGGAFGIAVMGAIAYNELRSLVSPGSTSHPALANALYKDVNEVTPFSYNSVSPVGSIKSLNGRYLKVTDVSFPGYTSNDNVGVRDFVDSYRTVDVVGPPDSHGVGYANLTRYQVSIVSAPTPEYVARPDDQVAPYLYNQSLSDLYPQAVADVDNLIQADPSIIQLPPSLSKDVSDANKQVSNNAISTADQKKTESLKAIRDAALAKYNADPSDENKAALDKAEADLAAAESDQAQHNLQQQKDADEDSVEFTDPDLPSLKKIDLSPLLQIGAALNDKFPFSLLQTLSSIAFSLVATPVAPSFTISFPPPFNYDWVVSLSAWDTWAATFRFLIGAAFLVSVSMAIMKRWV
jgi:hypothetical protein